MANALKLQCLRSVHPVHYRTGLANQFKLSFRCLVPTITWFEHYSYKCLNKADYKITRVPSCAIFVHPASWRIETYWCGFMKLLEPSSTSWVSAQSKYPALQTHLHISHAFWFFLIFIRCWEENSMLMFHMRFHQVNKILQKKKCNFICYTCENNVMYLL